MCDRFGGPCPVQQGVTGLLSGCAYETPLGRPLVRAPASDRCVPPSIDEWDEFESGYGACYASWLVEHGSEHPDAAEVRARAGRQRAGYFGGYRGIMGMAYLALLAV